MVVAASEFRDIEYIVPKAFFEQAGHKVTTSSSTPESIGRFGYKIGIDLLVKEVDVNLFDGVFFVGGKGSLQFLEDDTAKNMVLSFISQQKLVGAICAAPRNFLSWGIMKGRKATGHNWDGEFGNLCKDNRAEYIEDQAVVIDNGVLTANGPEASEEAALKFMSLLF